MVRASSSSSSAPHPARRPRRWRRRLAWSAAALVAALALTGGSFLAFLNHRVVENLTYSDLLPAVDATARPTRPSTAGDALNLLILGSDSRTSQAGDGRSDVIVVAHISADRSRVDLIHFPRDLYVDIPGHGKDKINAAFAFGGAPLLVQTLEGLIEVPIDHVAIIDFDGFVAMTDAVGGVDVTVAEASPGFPVGTMHMDGATALTFVRERHNLSQGDIGRGKRQQAFITAVLRKGLSADVLLNPVRLTDYLDAATRNMTVDRALDGSAIRALAFSMRGIRGGAMTSWTAPWSGVGTAAGGASIVTPSDEQMAVLADALARDDLVSYEDPVSPTSGFSR